MTILTAKQSMELRAALRGRKLSVSYGAGVDSTAMLVALHEAGVVPDVITFADTGGEKPETYQHLHLMQGVLADWGFPAVDVVRNNTLPTTPYDSLEGNCLANETLPGLAFGPASCSIKWKQVPQDQFLMGVSRGPNKRPAHPLWLAAQRDGDRIVKLIGYDSSTADLKRANKAEATMAKMAAEGKPVEFEFVYPLQILGWKRGDCVKAIAEALGTDMVPIKSACFYCPASKQWELYWLAAHHPEMFERALKIERTALTGHNSRYDEIEFGDKWENYVKDGKKFPSSSTVVGLGRKLSWNQWAVVNQVVDSEFRVRREHVAKFAAMADKMMADDNALDVRSCGMGLAEAA